MEVLISRKRKEPTFTQGEVTVDEKHHAWSEEDRVREDGIYVFGETAMPVGRYRLITSYSNRFKKRMLQIINVRGGNIMFGDKSVDAAGLRVHGGNDEKDSLGCPLIGAEKNDTKVFNCKDVVDSLFSMVDEADKTGEVYLTIRNDF